MKAGTLLRSVALLGGMVLVFTSPSVEANPRATFSAKGTSEEPNDSDPDGFPGTSGDGWNGSWEPIIQIDQQVEVDANVTDTKPFDGESGDHLQLRYLRGEGKAGCRAGVVRSVSNDPSSGGIDFAKPYTVKFQFRLDEVSGTFTEMTDQLTFAESLEINPRGPGEADRWLIVYRGGRGKPGDAGGVWTAFHGSGPEKQLLDFGPDNLPIDLNSVCQVTVSVDPAKGVWDVEVSCQGTTFRASDARGGAPLELRNKKTPMDPPHLSFRASRNGEGKSLLWSLDNIEVVQQGN